jgi:hypothetical protein
MTTLTSKTQLPAAITSVTYVIRKDELQQFILTANDARPTRQQMDAYDLLQMFQVLNALSPESFMLLVAKALLDEHSRAVRPTGKRRSGVVVRSPSKSRPKALRSHSRKNSGI